MEPQHLIQKFIFDVEYDSEEKAYQFQTRVSSCVKEKLVQLSDEIFTEIAAGKNIGIKKLELDLGEIGLENFEAEVYNKLKEQLTDKLKLVMAGVGINSMDETPDFISPEKTNLTTLQFFLESGTLPWSARKSDPYFVNQLIVRLIEDTPDAVRSLIGLIIQKEEIRLRIIRQVEEEVIFKIVKLWAGSEKEKFYKFYSDLVKIYSFRPVLKNTLGEYRELVLKFILTEVLVKKEYKKSIVDLTKSFLEFASVEVSISKESSVQLFLKALFIQPGIHTVITDFELIQLIKDPKKVEAVLTKLNLQTSIHEAIVELVKETEGRPKEDRTTSPEERSLSQEESRLEKIDQERFEQFKKQETEKRKKILIDFFSVIKYIENQDSIRSQIPRLELIIKEFVRVNPAFVKKVLEDANIIPKEFVSQFVLQLFSEEVLQLLLREVFLLEKKEFIRLKEQASLTLVKTFFETGILPYSFIPQNFKSADIEELFLNVYKLEEIEIISIIKESVLASKDKDFKIAQIKMQFSKNFMIEYFRNFPEVLQGGIELKKEDSGQVVEFTALSEVKSIDYVIFILKGFIQNNSLPQEVTFSVSEIIEKGLTINKNVVTVFLASLKTPELQLVRDAVSGTLSDEVVKTIIEFKESVKKVLTAEIRTEEEINNELAEKAKEKIKQRTSEQQADYKKLEGAEPIYIGNAGLVLVHPFLTRFFGLLNLLDKRAFKDELSAHKAAHILQYLVNKSTNSEEHELVLNKLICGIELHTPLMRDIEITEEDKLTCENLLEGVIQNWAILKKTSNDNFRGSFLMREGRLMPEATNWRLRVEERGYDILVEKIPWSISMIRLPWMKCLINVEWK